MKSFRQILFEWAALTLIGMLYLGYFLAAKSAYDVQDMKLDALDPSNRVSGLEHERLSGILIPVEIGLETYGHVPTWNPYLGGGTPLINNAFSYLFNPFYSLPVLVLGAVQGGKVAIALALLLAGYNAWALARAIGLGTVARVTAGALYMMSGGIIAKFHTGHFQLGVSLAWPPLVLAGLWWTLRTRDRRAPVLMAVAFALVFFSGNIYYSLHTLVCAALITAVHLLDRGMSGWQWRWDRLRRVAVGGAFAVGLAALQFIPIWVVRDFVTHQSTLLDYQGQLDERYEMTQAIVNYLYPWENWSVFEGVDFRQLVVVDYAYIGPTVFLLIALALITRRRLPTRAVFIALMLAVVMMVWGAAQTPLLQMLYTRIPLLAEFRYLGRAHAIGALWWIILAAICLDVLWRAARTAIGTAPSFDRYDHLRLWRALSIAVLMWLYVFAFSVADNSARYNLALSHSSLYLFLTERAFATFQQAAEVLWWFVTLAIALDTLLMILSRRSGMWRGVSTRALRLGLIVLAMTAMADVMRFNSRLFTYGRPVTNFSALYAAARENQLESPIPSVRDPFSPSTYDVYYAEMRSFYLNEGWTPETLPSILPEEAPSLVILPDWAIVTNTYGSASYDLSRQYVDERANARVYCQSQPAVDGIDIDPCNLDNRSGSILYRLTDALPYAFVVPEGQLRTAPESIAVETVYPARVQSHQQDTVTIVAQTPDEIFDYALIVQEAQFPGWQAFIDGVPVEPFAAGNVTVIRMLPGEHTYTLRFHPPGFSAGVAVFALTMVVMGLYLRDTKRAVQRRTTLVEGD